MGRNGGIDSGLCPSALRGVLLHRMRTKALRILSMPAGSSGARDKRYASGTVSSLGVGCHNSSAGDCRDPEQTWGHLSHRTLERSQILTKSRKPLTKRSVLRRRDLAPLVHRRPSSTPATFGAICSIDLSRKLIWNQSRMLRDPSGLAVLTRDASRRPRRREQRPVSDPSIHDFALPLIQIPTRRRAVGPRTQISHPSDHRDQSSRRLRNAGISR